MPLSLDARFQLIGSRVSSTESSVVLNEIDPILINEVLGPRDTLLAAG